MTTTRTQQMLEKVRALLAKADSTTFPAEADAFRAKADQLMTAYAIEQWQVEAAQAGAHARPEPEVRDLNFMWWYSSARKDELWSLFNDTARHCRVVIAVRGYSGSGRIPVIGLPSDIDYFDMMFTHLMLQMGMRLEPKPEAHLSFAENAYVLRAAGMVRRRAGQLLWDGGHVASTGIGKGWADKWDDLTYDQTKTILRRMRRDGEAWGREHDRDVTTKVSPITWQRSFAIGFVREISQRFHEMRRVQTGAPGGESTALAIRDILQVARDKYDELFPRQEVRGNGKAGRAVGRNLRIDEGAMQIGRVAGRHADIAVKGERIGSRKQLES